MEERRDEKREDKLDVLFRMQAGLDAYIREKRGLDYSRGEWVCKKALALMVELGEVDRKSTRLNSSHMA